MTFPMADPLANPAAISRRFQTGLSAQAIADRVNTLHQNGHQWMPADMTMSLAQSPTTDGQMVGIAHTIKSTLASTWNGFTEAFDDPVLHKEPSKALALSRLIHSSLGPIPVVQTDLTEIQGRLQQLGFGKGLTSDGVWGSDWNNAYNEYAQHVVDRQLAGDRPGSTSTGNAAHHWYDDFKPSHAFDAIVGFAKSLPADVRSLAADLASGTVNLTVDAKNLVTDPIGTLGDIHWGRQHDAAARAGAAVENIGRADPITADQYEQIANNPARLVQDVGLVLAIVPVVGQASRAALTARTIIAGGATRAAAERGPGVIAKSLGGFTKKELTGETAARSGASLAGIERQTGLRGSFAETGARGPLRTSVFTNIPLLGRVGPVVGRLADEDGFYYALRTHLAAPYRYGAVQIAGDVGQRVMLTGAALRGGAQASDFLTGSQSQLSSDIQNTEASDLIDRNIQRIIGTPFEHPFTDAVDLLGFVLHGPLGSTANSTRAGDAVQATVDASGEILGKVGTLGDYQRAVQTAYGGKLPSIEDLARPFGSQDHFERFLHLKAADTAADHHVMKNALREQLAYGTAEYRDRIGQLADEVWGDPAAHIAAHRELLLQDGGVGMVNRFAADMIHSGMDAREYSSDGAAWMRAGDLLTQSIRNGDARHLFGQRGQTVINKAQEDFDYGLGQANPMRVSSMTRREFNAETSHLMGRIRTGVTSAREHAAKTIADANRDLEEAKRNIAGLKSDHPDFIELRVKVRKAQGALQSARYRQQKLEEALGSNLTYRVDDALKKLRGPRGSAAEWERVANDIKRLRMLVGPSLGREEKFNLLDHLAGGLDSDAVYTKINGAPRPSDAAIGSGDWMREHLPHANGALGLGRIETKSTQQAYNDLNGFEQALARAVADPEEVERITEELKNYGHVQFGLDERSLGVFDGEPGRLLEVLRAHADKLASDVFLTPDAPPRLREAIKQMADHGYKPMLGSHIGHLWDGSLPPLEDLDGAVSRRRRILTAGGVLDPTQVSSRAVGRNARIRVLNEMQHEIADNPKIKMPARTTAETIMAVIEDKGLLKPNLKLPEKMAVSLSRRFHKPEVARLATDRGISLAEAAEQHEQELARALQIRDIPRREFMKTLTTPGDFENGARWEGVDERTAALLYRAALKGYASRPNYLMGLAGIEDWARAGFWVGGKLAHAFPDSGAIQAFANAPNEIVQLRNRMRFSLSPMYDFRRVAKTNFKMALDKVVPIFNPLKYLEDNKVFKQAHELLSKVLGEYTTAGYDDADRYLHTLSFYGVYNARHYEAYYAWQKHLEGWDEDKIREGIHRVFEYGSTRSGGRSALERTVNTLWFPFSFEKTLIRNTGMYMLDHPQQALLATGIMDAYNRANHDEKITHWLDAHAPVLHDLQKLNAFAHGISPGEFGGINAPLLNLLMPQQWNKEDFNIENLKRNLPIWNDFGNLMADLYQQGKIANAAARNAVDYATTLGAPRKPFDPYRPMETDFAQREDASAMRAKFIAALTPVLDANAHGGDIRWPDSPILPPGVQGERVNRTSIGYLVKRWYPAYDPSFGQTYSIKQQNDAKLEIGKIAQTDPQKAQEYKVLWNLADSFAGKLNSDAYDTPEAAQITNTFRVLSAAAAEQDSQFYKFYDKHFRWLFGSLEEIQGVNPL